MVYFSLAEDTLELIRNIFSFILGKTITLVFKKLIIHWHTRIGDNLIEPSDKRSFYKNISLPSFFNMKGVIYSIEIPIGNWFETHFRL